MDEKHNKAWFIGLTIDCPFGIRMESCPFTSMNNIPLLEKIELVDEMISDEIEKIIEHHGHCLSKREGPWMNTQLIP